MTKFVFSQCFGVFIVVQSYVAEQTLTNTINDSGIPCSFNEYEQRVCAAEPTCHLLRNAPPSWSTWDSRNCMCDPECAAHGDCCLDTPYYKDAQQRENFPLFACPTTFQYYMKQSCPHNFTDKEVQLKCENYTIGEEHTDPRVMKPVVDVLKKITYANEYCAACNDVIDFQPWSLAFNCAPGNNWELPENEKEVNGILSNMKFDSITKTFRSVFKDKNYKCWHTWRVPSDLVPLLRPCLPKMISTCSDSRNKNLVHRCKSYTSVVYKLTSATVNEGTIIYKNKDCAECNYDGQNLFYCVDYHFGAPGPSFTVGDKAELFDLCGLSTGFQTLKLCDVENKFQTLTEFC